MKQAGLRVVFQLILALASFAFLMFVVEPVYAQESVGAGCHAVCGSLAPSSPAS